MSVVYEHVVVIILNRCHKWKDHLFLDIQKRKASHNKMRPREYQLLRTLLCLMKKDVKASRPAYLMPHKTDQVRVRKDFLLKKSQLTFQKYFTDLTIILKFN